MRRSGFTLIELLIVVAIIGILAAIAVPNFLNAQTRAKIARVYSDIKAQGTALEQYRLDNNNYPPSNVSRSALASSTTPVAYIATLPMDIFHNKLTRHRLRLWDISIMWNVFLKMPGSARTGIHLEVI